MREANRRGEPGAVAVAVAAAVGRGVRGSGVRAWRCGPGRGLATARPGLRPSAHAPAGVSGQGPGTPERRRPAGPSTDPNRGVGAGVAS